jgi:hypothetical protein
MPIKNAYDEVIAVAQVINKNPDIDNGQFTEKDEKVRQVPDILLAKQKQNSWEVIERR